MKAVKFKIHVLRTTHVKPLTPRLHKWLETVRAWYPVLVNRFIAAKEVHFQEWGYEFTNAETGKRLHSFNVDLPAPLKLVNKAKTRLQLATLKVMTDANKRLLIHGKPLLGDIKSNPLKYAWRMNYARFTDEIVIPAARAFMLDNAIAYRRITHPVDLQEKIYTPDFYQEMSNAVNTQDRSWPLKWWLIRNWDIIKHQNVKYANLFTLIPKEIRPNSAVALKKQIERMHLPEPTR